MISPHKTPALAKLAMLFLFAIGAVTVLETTSISAQEPGRTITSPFGVANPYMNASDASESGSNGDTFVDPETGEVGHIIRNPFGVANPDGVDTGIDIPDDAGEEVGGIITSPFGVPASDDIDTGVDTLDEDEEYLISLPKDEESDSEDTEDVEEGDDETSDDVKEFEEESTEITTEKYVPVIDNPIPRRESPPTFKLIGSSGVYRVESTESNMNHAPTFYVATGSTFLLSLTDGYNSSLNALSHVSINFDGYINALPEDFTFQWESNRSSFSCNANSCVVGKTYCVSVSFEYNGTPVIRCIKIVVCFNLLIDSTNDNIIDFGDEAEELNNPGKIIGFNNLDTDADGIPDFADGFDCVNGGTSAAGKSASFTELKVIISDELDISAASDYSIKFSFAESPYTVRTNASRSYYLPPLTGQLRIWTKDGGEARLKATVKDSTPGHHVPNNDPIPLNKLFSGIDPVGNTRTVTLYVEAVNPSTSAGGNAITATLCQNSTEMVSDSVKTTAVKVSAVTPNKTSDGSNVIKILIETNQEMEGLTGEDRYYTTAQKDDRKVKITAKVTPQIEGVPVYFEVIDPDDLSHYEGKELKDEKDNPPQYIAGSEDNECKDNNNGILPGPLFYNSFQKTLLSYRSIETDENGNAEIELTIRPFPHSGDNYIVRAVCVEPSPNEPFDKYFDASPPTPKTEGLQPPYHDLTQSEIDNVTGSLQYEQLKQTTIAQTSLLVAWKRTYIEHARMYKKGATVTQNAVAGDRILYVDNVDDFTLGCAVTVFLPNESGEHNTNVSAINTTTNTITLDNDLPWDAPKYSGVKMNDNNTCDSECYSIDTDNTTYTSYLASAFGGDTGGVDGGAFIEFKKIGVHNVPKYKAFPVDNTMFEYGNYWFYKSGKRNTMLLIAATKRCPLEEENTPLWGITNPKAISLIMIEGISNSNLNNPEQIKYAIQNTVNHEIGHIWGLNKSMLHIDNEDIDGNIDHLGCDLCIMSSGSIVDDEEIEFCIPCLEFLRLVPGFSPIP